MCTCRLVTAGLFLGMDRFLRIGLWMIPVN